MMNASAKTLELLKHRLSRDLESQKWDYRRQELQYLEAGQHLRSLNLLMWQVPGMTIAITGGLWYGATTVEGDAPRTWVLGFAAVVAALTIVILFRLRSLIEMHIQHQRGFESRNNADDRFKNTVVRCWSLALFAAAFVSAVGAMNPSSLTKRPSPDKPTPCCSVLIDVKTPEPPKVAAQCEQPAGQPTPLRKRKPCD